VYLQIVERLSLIPAQARLELITVETLELEPDKAFQVALANRLDFMNGRAALVDRWRLLEVSADALQSVVNVTASGDVRTSKNNPVSFRAPTGSFRMGLEFDAPFTRLLERNAYRESLIEYQRNRRNLIQSRDSLERGLRALIRTLEQRRQQLEIQRRAVSIAMRRVDETQLSLNEPPAPRLPGQRPLISPTVSFNLLSAQRALQSTQNNFLAAWLRYYSARLRLYRELGIMELAPDGMWIQKPIGDTDLRESPLPPALPRDLAPRSVDESAAIRRPQRRTDLATRLRALKELAGFKAPVAENVNTPRIIQAAGTAIDRPTSSQGWKPTKRHRDRE
jgi:hypothetical protein